MECYFDIETTGIDPITDKIITLQWQELDRYSGEPIDELQILKEWESSEEDILKKILPQIQCSNPWNFVMVGKNLLFDFNFLDKRATQYGLGGFDLTHCYNRVFLDLKHILVLINNGNFKAYDRILDIDGTLANVNVPKLYDQKKFTEIIEYIKKETDLTLKGFKILKDKLPVLQEHLKNLQS